MRAKDIPAQKATKIPLASVAYPLFLTDFGKGTLVTLNSRSFLPDADLITASYRYYA